MPVDSTRVSVECALESSSWILSSIHVNLDDCQSSKQPEINLPRELAAPNTDPAFLVAPAPTREQRLTISYQGFNRDEDQGVS